MVTQREGAMERKLDTAKNREFWEFVDATVKRAEQMPIWKRGGESAFRKRITEINVEISEDGPVVVVCRIDAEGDKG